MIALTEHSVGATLKVIVGKPWVVLDIETGDAPEEAIQQAMAGWKQPSNLVNPDVIEKRRNEAMEKIKERSALLDAAPLLCVGVQTMDGVVVFNGMSTEGARLANGEILGCGNERRMLLALRNYLNDNTNIDTALVGHNIRHFDLPKLRNAYLRHRLKLPEVFATKVVGNEQIVVDTAALFRAYSVEHRDDFCPSLDTVCEGLGLPKHKDIIKGSEVPKLHREGRHTEILVYNAIDCMSTTNAYLLMTGQFSGLE